MSTLHVRHVKVTLDRDFVPLIDVSDLGGQSTKKIQPIRLSRALAAYSLHHLAEVDPSGAAASVVDGGDDNGIDALLTTSAGPSLWVVQSKWISSGKGTPSLGEVRNFCAGVKDLVEFRLEVFNSKIRARKAEISAALENSKLSLHLVLIYTGSALGLHAKRALSDLLNELNEPTPMATLHVLCLGDIHEAISGKAQASGCNFSLGLLEWGKIDEPHRAYYGHAAASEIASLWQKHGSGLVVKNLRNFLGTTEVNEAVQATLATRPEDFWYFNNGITILCDSVSKQAVGGNSRSLGTFDCVRGSIVNGAQTAGNIARAYLSSPNSVESARVLVRLLSLEGTPVGYGTEITRATNNQNRIERKDFVSQDKEQERLRTELQIEGKAYVFRTGEALLPPDQGLSLDEATVALACNSRSLQNAIWSKKEIGRLWDPLNGRPYIDLFNSELSGPKLWRLVVVAREIEGCLKEAAGTASSTHRRNIAVHGNRFIMAHVFSRLDPAVFEGDVLDAPIDLAKLRATTIAVLDEADQAAQDLFPDAMISRLFYNIGKCRKMSDAIGGLGDLKTLQPPAS